MQTAQVAAAPSSIKRMIALGAVAMAVIAAIVFPFADKAANPGATQPGVITFLGVGLAVIAMTAILFLAGLRKVLPRSTVFVVSAAGYSGLLIVIKFALSPLALYEHSRAEGFIILNSDASSSGFAVVAFTAVALVTGLLYGTAFFLLHVYFRSRLRARLGIPIKFETRFLTLYVVMLFLGVISAITLGSLATLEYLVSFLYSAGIGIALAFALLGALVLCVEAFREASDQAALVRNVTLLSGFAWIGLAFIAAYHVLWLVFILVVISIWPLKSMSVK